ncbi:tyrosine-type recombinase/integrase [Clostridium beijerinckii]|uniref:Integrase n=1 Tax=Clostridium beijerinckii TaxID=1520 RepID=A0AAE5H2R5_CLOBE|nr:site-specific integrase [Clostridium beijerinckii]ALB44588.1 site-specific integrase [Clostridium beijerinckii NRRL B-598]NSB13022.1 integrase [Clostridium beijerinckii]OOM22124.1 transposase from transposon [Clostridium beijerinckii]
MAKTIYKKKIKNGKEYYFHRLRHENLENPKDIYAKTVKELESKIKQIKYDLEHEIVNNKECFETFFTDWLFDVHFGHLKPSTKENYEGVFRMYIKNSSLSKIKVKDLKLIDVQKFYNNLVSNNCTIIRIKNIHKIIRPFVRYLYDNNIIIKDFSKAIILPKEDEKTKLARGNKIIPFTLEEEKTFLAAIKGHDSEMLFVTALYSGLRQGELFALTWDDINFENAYIDVNKTYRYIADVSRDGRSSGYNLIQTPKTHKSIRKVPIPQFLIKMLLQYRNEQRLQKIKYADVYKDNNLVFCNDLGAYLVDSTIGRQYKIILKNNNIPVRKFHDMRHTFATRLFELGEEPKTVQELLGHSTVSITLNTYTHVLESVKEKAISKLDELHAILK